MNLDEYIEISAATAVYPEAGTGSPMAVAYCCLGLVGELAELLDAWDNYVVGLKTDSVAQVVEEAGDCWWYLAAIFRETGVGVEGSLPAEDGTFEPDEHIVMASRSAGLLAQNCKRLIKDGAFRKTDGQIDHLLETRNALADVIDALNLKLEYVLAQNVVKLQGEGSGDDP